LLRSTSAFAERQIEVERDEYEETIKKIEELDAAIQSVLVTSAKAGLGPADIEGAVAELTREGEVAQRRGIGHVT
jgi:hypothetical protein